jgi:hypothetical protein
MITLNDEQQIKGIQGLLGVTPDGVWGPKSQAALDKLTKAAPVPVELRGKGSWYSQYKGKYTWIDTGDKPNSNALGVPDDQQGVAFYNQATLGKWFLVTAPNGQTLKLQQTDIGPHPKTGRKIDIAAVAAEQFGYSPSNFPTDGMFSWKAAG